MSDVIFYSVICVALIFMLNDTILKEIRQWEFLTLWANIMHF